MTSRDSLLPGQRVKLLRYAHLEGGGDGAPKGSLGVVKEWIDTSRYIVVEMDSGGIVKIKMRGGGKEDQVSTFFTLAGPDASAAPSDHGPCPKRAKKEMTTTAAEAAKEHGGTITSRDSLLPGQRVKLLRYAHLEGGGDGAPKGSLGVVKEWTDTSRGPYIVVEMDSGGIVKIKMRGGGKEDQVSTFFALAGSDSSTAPLSSPAPSLPEEAHAPLGSAGDFTACFFPASQSFNTLITVLHEATNTIDVAMYLFTEDELCETLIKKHRSGIKVRVFSDDDMETKFDTSDLEKLRAAGIEVRIDHSTAHAHHKFVVVDRKVSINGSFNWTKPSKRGDNRENILICRRPEVAARFAERFEILWATHLSKDDGIEMPLAPAAPEVAQCRALFFPDEDDANFHFFVEALSNARRTIDVAVFILTVREAVEALIEAHNRGVHVRVITDDSKAHIHDGKHIAALRESGVEVRMDNSRFHMHHKFSVVDGAIVITGSFNWTRAAENTNLEDCLVVGGNPDLAAQYTAEFDRLWAEFSCCDKATTEVIWEYSVRSGYDRYDLSCEQAVEAAFQTYQANGTPTTVRAPCGKMILIVDFKQMTQRMEGRDRTRQVRRRVA